MKFKIWKLNNWKLFGNYTIWSLEITLFVLIFNFLPKTADAGFILQRPLYIGLTSGLVGYWSFDGPDVAVNTAYDRSGQGNNGTLTNGPVRAIGRIGQALNFDGVDDEVSVTGSPQVSSISYWIKPAANNYSLGLRGTTGRSNYLLENGLFSGTPTPTRYINGVIPAGETLGSELLTNGNIESGVISPWTASIQGTGAGTLSVTTANQQSGTYGLDFNITNGSTVLTHMQVFHNSNFSLTAGTLYKATFGVKGSVAKSGLNVTPRKELSPFTEYGVNYIFDITTSFVTHTFYFYSTVTASDAQFFFYGGNLGAYNLYLDNISVKPVNSVGDVTNNVWNFVSVTLSSSITANNINMANVNSRFFNGNIDDVRVYNRALNQDEIKRLYKIGATTKINVPRKDTLTNGLVGYWSFDGPDMNATQAQDASGNANHGTLTNGPTRAIGRIGQALNFDGVDDYVTGSRSAMPLPATITAWIKRGSGTNNPVIVSHDSGANNGYRIGLTSNTTLTFTLGGVADYDCGQTVPINQWTFVAAVATGNSGTRTCYVNGVASSATTIGNVSGTISQFNIGIRGDKLDTTKFTGLIDDVRVYNRALNQDEIKRLYKIGATTKINVPRKDTLTNGLVGYWSFDGPDMNATQARDASGNANHGTLTNGPTRAIGKIGQALDFDGSDDYVSVADSASLDITSALTVSLWIKTTTTSNLVVLEKSNNNTNYVLHTCSSSTTGCNGAGKIQFNISTTASTGRVGSNVAINNNAWRHVVGTFDDAANTLRIYVDGVLDNTNSGATDTLTANALALLMGSRSGSFSFPGSLDDVRVYNRVLNQDEIKRLYNMGR